MTFVTFLQTTANEKFAYIKKEITKMFGPFFQDISISLFGYSGKIVDAYKRIFLILQYRVHLILHPIFIDTIG